ncbi:MAG: hypothetical protein EBZ36_01425 [Acidobacteria bacterium]|nr:hypothetical protein [Acidobacteriota bacterium]
MERNTVPYETAAIELDFPDTDGLRDYLRTLASLLQHQAECHRTIDRAGQTRKNIPFRDLRWLIDEDRLYSVDYRLRLGHHVERLLLRPANNHLQLKTRLLFNCQPTDLLWLQSSLDPPSAFPLIALPVHRQGLTLEALHPIIALAVHTAGLTSASCAVAGQSFAARWSSSPTGPDSLPVRSSRSDHPWQVDPACRQATLWFTPSRPIPVPSIDDAWWRSLLDLRQRWPESRAEIKAHLAPLLPFYPAGEDWELEEIDAAQLAAANGAGRVAIIQPEDRRVRVAIDPTLKDKQWGRVLLHSLAHLALGHLRPGDLAAHIDDLQSVITPIRHRDQLAGQYARRYWIKPGWCEPESLDDCTPEQKARLGMWRILNARLGEGHLHEKARSYQPTSYQRQAAARLVDILDKYHGALLCDGVGLGKTYVATTVMVHYINTWLDQQGTVSGKRITIIAPNQVVSTWLNEALPSISDLGGRSVQIRILGHHSLSVAEQLTRKVAQGVTDLEHLLRSDLVIIDEAHGFRNITTKRSKFLGNVLRTRFSANDPRKILLLSATPINNGLKDLNTLLKLLFSPYRVVENPADITQTIHNLMEKPDADAMFKTLPKDFRDVFNDSGIVSVKKYLKDQKALLDNLTESIDTIVNSPDVNSQLLLSDILNQKNRIAEELLDQIVVQRSRLICEEIEKASGQVKNFHFRAEMGKASEIKYAQYSDGYREILLNLCPLFDVTAKPEEAISLLVDSWNDILIGEPIKTASALRRTQLLKRLESSLGSLLVSYVRLVGKHLNKLACLKSNAHKHNRFNDADQLEKGVQDVFTSLGSVYEPKVRRLLGHLKIDTEELNGVQLDNLWCNLKDPMLADFGKLLRKMPVLIDNILGDLDPSIWPKIANSTTWSQDSPWGLQLLRDEKTLELIRYLLIARRKGQKIVIFSEFTETIEYIKSILQAITRFDPGQWQTFQSNSSINQFTRDEILALIETTKDVTGNTPAADQDRIIYCFAPYYRIGPTIADDADRSVWRRKWTDAINEPVNVLIATDILAEGVNLQDASTLINFDMHWNPVRLIQRSGRIDRRLNKKIEETRHYPELASLAKSLDRSVPAYYWHGHPHEPPQIVNMLLPDELEQKLLLTKKIWFKAVLISLVLGFDAKSIVTSNHDNVFDLRGVIGINAIAGDRAIEQLIHYRDRLARELTTDGLKFEWADTLLSHVSATNGVSRQVFIADLEHKSPFGTVRPFQFSFDDPHTAEAAVINTNVIAATNQTIQTPESILESMNNIGNEQLLNALKSVLGSERKTHCEYAVDNIESTLRQMMLKFTDPMHRFDIQQGEIKSCFIYQYDGETDQSTSAEAHRLEEVNV